MRIVVAEDEERSCKGISRLIRSIDESYSVVAQAADGKEALEKIRKLRPDVVLTDIQMPFMDGLALVQAAHREELYPHFAIISAYAEFEYAKKAISYGVQEFLVKPVTYDDVENLLQKLDQLPRNPKYHYNSGKKGLHPLIGKVTRQIEQNYTQKISLEELAEQLSVTPEYLSTLFSREMGESFSTYLQIFRVEKAKQILKTEDAKIYQVAAQLGFSDVKYFCKVFKKITGIPPSQFVYENRSPK